MSLPPPSPPEFDHTTSYVERKRLMDDHATALHHHRRQASMWGSQPISFDNNWGNSGSSPGSGGNTVGGNSFDFSRPIENDIFTPPPVEIYVGDYGGYSEGVTGPAKAPMTAEEKKAVTIFLGFIGGLTLAGAGIYALYQDHLEEQTRMYPAMSVFADDRGRSYTGYGETVSQATYDAGRKCGDAANNCGEIGTVTQREPACIAVALNNAEQGRFYSKKFNDFNEDILSPYRASCGTGKGAFNMPNGQCKIGRITYHCSSHDLQQEAAERTKFHEELEAAAGARHSRETAAPKTIAAAQPQPSQLQPSQPSGKTDNAVPASIAQAHVVNEAKSEPETREEKVAKAPSAPAASVKYTFHLVNHGDHDIMDSRSRNAKPVAGLAGGSCVMVDPDRGVFPGERLVTAFDGVRTVTGFMGAHWLHQIGHVDASQCHATFFKPEMG